MHRQAASNTPPATISSIVVPQKPTLAQFEVMFEGTPLILERATDYWESGRVSSVQEIAPQLYHAQVSGSADDCYDVDIRLSKDAHGENANEAKTLMTKPLPAVTATTNPQPTTIRFAYNPPRAPARIREHHIAST